MCSFCVLCSNKDVHNYILLCHVILQSIDKSQAVIEGAAIRLLFLVNYMQIVMRLTSYISINQLVVLTRYFLEYPIVTVKE